MTAFKPHNMLIFVSWGFRMGVGGGGWWRGGDFHLYEALHGDLPLEYEYVLCPQLRNSLRSILLLGRPSGGGGWGEGGYWVGLLPI